MKDIGCKSNAARWSEGGQGDAYEVLHLVLGFAEETFDEVRTECVYLSLC